MVLLNEEVVEFANDFDGLVEFIERELLDGFGLRTSRVLLLLLIDDLHLNFVVLESSEAHQDVGEELENAFVYLQVECVLNELKEFTEVHFSGGFQLEIFLHEELHDLLFVLLEELAQQLSRLSVRANELLKRGLEGLVIKSLWLLYFLLLLQFLLIQSLLLSHQALSLLFFVLRVDFPLEPSVPMADSVQITLLQVEVTQTFK